MAPGSVLLRAEGFGEAEFIFRGRHEPIQLGSENTVKDAAIGGTFHEAKGFQIMTRQTYGGVLPGGQEFPGPF